MQEQHKKAIEMLDRAHGYLDKPHESAAEQLRHEIQKLIDWFEMQKNARDLEGQARHIQDMVMRIGDNEMDYGDRDDLKDRCDEMRMALRKLF